MTLIKNILLEWFFIQNIDLLTMIMAIIDIVNQIYFLL